MELYETWKRYSINQLNNLIQFTINISQGCIDIRMEDKDYFNTMDFGKKT